MVVLIRADVGDKVRKCDAHCYDAIGPVCKCICEGMNHSMGLSVARRNTEDWAREAGVEPAEAGT